jgi:tetratricopeptide (TPR) repeat protein
MEKVILRVYNREIESMIEGGKLDEAVAHCQHILKTFPMHVETYRLLGKAFLETRRYADAADIFQRVLLAVPDDFMSHLGMSIIRDDQGRLNDAIWHMERALEIQPSNSAIQSELRRLYGRRDGVEPSKIRLGRDALANMYSQGELFPQAIAELRSLLTEDPNRPDLQVMLMRAVYRSGQMVETKEIATTLLKKYPYCMDALRVIVDILHDTTRTENILVFRHRLFMLDPYSSFSLESAFSSDQVADSAVSLERLDYKPGLVSAPSQPDWASSLGIKLDSERFGPRTASAIDAGTVPFPDWIRPVGWLDATGGVKDASADTEGVLPIAPIAKADIPEWLISKESTMTNPEANQEPDHPSEKPPEDLPEGEDDIPDWLKSIYPSKVNKEAQKESQESGNSSPLSGDIGDKAITPPTVPGKAPEQPQEFIESLPAGEVDIPDWLKPLAPLAVTGDEIIKPKEHVESQPANSEDVPGFLKPGAQEESIEDALLEPQATEEHLSEEGQEVPELLESKIPVEATGKDLLALPMTDESLLEEGEDVSGHPEARIPAGVAETIKVVSEPALPEETVLRTGSEPLAEEASSSDGAAFPDWMKEIGAGTAAAVLLAVTPIEEAPKVEQVVSEQPVTEIPAYEQPVMEQPAIEQVVPEQPVMEQPAIEQVVPEQPVMEQPAIEQVVPEQPVMEQPAIGQAFPEQPDLAGSTRQEAAQPPAAESGTIPLDRSIEIPEWLEEPVEKPDEASEMGAQESDRNVPETAPIEPVGGMDFEAMASSSSQPIDAALPEEGEKPVSGAPSEMAAETAVEPAGGEEVTLAWLERLSADQETTEEGPLVSPEGSQATAPEVDQEISDTQPMLQAMEETVPAPSGTTETMEEGKSTPSIEPSGEEKPAAAAEELPGWLKGLGNLSGPIETQKAGDDVPESQALPIPTMEPGSTSAPDEPVWEDENVPVTGQANPTKPEEWVPAESKLVASPDLGQTTESKPVNETSLANVLGPTSETKQFSKPESPAESIPVTESVPASETKQVSSPEPPVESTPGAESGSASEILPFAIPEPAPESMSVGEPEPVTESTPIAEPLLSSVQNLTHPSMPKETGIISNVSLQEKDSELLASAQAFLKQNSLDESMKQYSRLIKKGHLLDDVIKDLHEAIHRNPVDVNIWQTLGDAFMRVNRLEDALDAYTKGEELLR